jgi:HAD superfamily hydrolase (TIGR01509 family)
MSDTPILLLDVMDTLVVDPFFHAVPAHFGCSLEELLADKDPHAWVDFELARIDEATFFERFFRDDREWSGPAMKQAMTEAYRWVDGIEGLLGELQAQGVAMHALSNYTEWYRIIEDRLAVSRYLPWSFVSCDTGFRKPDPDTYRHAAETLGVAPERCIFVDDRGRNCKGAASIGMGAVKFQSAAQLRAALVERGVLAG